MSIARRGGVNAGGAAHAYPLCVNNRRNGDDQDTTSMVLGQDYIRTVEVFQDFILASGSTMPAPYVIKDVSAAGSPTGGIIADEPNGVVELTCDNTSEAQVIGVSWNDQRMIPGTKRPYFFCRFYVNTMPSTAQRIVIGLASDYNATFDSTTINTWFRLEASADLLVEADDNTTNTDDQDTAFDIVVDTWYTCAIDCRANGDIVYLLGDSDGGNMRQVKKLTGITLPSTALQPFIMVQKDSGTGVPSLYVDFTHVIWDR